MEAKYTTAAVVLAGSLFLAACGGGGNGTAATEPTVPETPIEPGLSDVTTGLAANYTCSNNVDDSVGTAHGTPEGGLSYGDDRHGNAGSACNFDGIDAKFTVASTIHPAGGTGMTISFWVKTGLTSFNGSMFYATGNSGFRVSEMLKYVVYPGSTNNAATTLPTDTWTHIVGTYEDSTELIKIYRDGVLMAEKVKGSKIGGLNITSLQVGQTTWPVTTYFTGALDEIRLYGRPLSDSEVAQLYDFQK